MSCSTTRAGELTNAVLDFIVLNMRPVSIVGSVGFRRLLCRLEPGYCVPSHTHMASLLAKKHVEGQGRLRKLLEEAEAVALTCGLVKRWKGTLP